MVSRQEFSSQMTMTEGLEELHYRAGAKERRKRRDKAEAKRLGMTDEQYRDRVVSVFRAKARAKRLGIHYWPALLAGPYEVKVNPQAFVIADKILSARYGPYDPLVSGNRGGWDSAGHYGLSPLDVGKMWVAAGCRNSRKFRAQVRSGVVAKKGDTLEFFLNYARGHSWADRNRINKMPFVLSRKALAALGRLSWPCRWAALHGLFENPPQERGVWRSVVRIRHLNWAAVAKVQAAQKIGNVRAMAPYLPPQAICRLMGLRGRYGMHLEELARMLSPSYPTIPFDMAQKICAGVSPAELSGNKLTGAEAHDWLSQGATCFPEEFLCRKIHDRTDVRVFHRSIKVVRWLDYLSMNKERWAALLKQREAPGPGGTMRTFAAVSILDEVGDEDIHTGKDGVDKVIRRAAERLGAAFLERSMRDHRVLCSTPSWASKLGKHVRLLRTPAELAQEGKDLAHCVGGYVSPVASGQCWILSVHTPHGRSTVELSPDLKVRQHNGRGNCVPPKRNEVLVDALVNRIRKGGVK
jgi:hypothetical protein